VQLGRSETELSKRERAEHDKSCRRWAIVRWLDSTCPEQPDVTVRIIK
jgi:hypothetical protein